MSARVHRRDGFYEVVGNGRYFQVDKVDKCWRLRAYYGQGVGWSDPEYFGTYREAVDAAKFYCAMSEED